MEFINASNICILIFFVGFMGLLIKRHIMKSIICITLMHVAIILYFVSPPVNLLGETPYVDPLPQALMLTEIVIGVGVTAVALTMFIHVYHTYGTSSWIKAALKREKE